MAGFRPKWRPLVFAVPPAGAGLRLWTTRVEGMGGWEAATTTAVVMACLCVFSVAEDAWEHWRAPHRDG